MKFAFLMDPLETINIKKDTTYSFIKESHRRGHDCYYIGQDDISFKNNSVQLNTLKIEPTDNEEKQFHILEKKSLSAELVDAIFIRPDPPFDDRYLRNTWLLDLCKRPYIMNNPKGIRTVNEKIVALHFKSIIPDSLITQEKNDYLEFLNEHKKIIIKPLNGYGGQGIFVINEGDTNANVTFETLIKLENSPILCQSYIPEASIGDKRILLLDGDPLGAVLRVHNKVDHRNNFFAGGKAIKTEITPNDKKIIETIRPFLKLNQLSFVGIDIIGNYLIEINVTSPTCLQEMNTIYGQKLEKKVLDFIESEIKINTKKEI